MKHLSAIARVSVITITISILVVFGYLWLYHIRYMGTHAIPMLPKVEIPSSQIYVRVYINSNNHYRYGIFSSDPYLRYGTRSLGSAQVHETMIPSVLEESPGIFRIVWGSGNNAAYTVIDVKNRLIVEDSNPANKRNQPFERIKDERG